MTGDNSVILSKSKVSQSSYKTKVQDGSKSTLSEPSFNTNNNELLCMSSKKLVFPKIEEKIENVKDTRDHFQILSSIINTLNEKLDTNTKILWDEICMRNVKTPCYYKSGLSKLTSDLKKLSREWKLENLEKSCDNVDQSINMPESFKTQVHDPKCKQVNGQCNYFSDLSSLSKSLDHIDCQDTNYLSLIKDSCTFKNLKCSLPNTIENIINSLMVNPQLSTLSKFLKRCKNILNRKGQLSRHLVKRIYFIIQEHNKDKNEVIKEIYMNNLKSPTNLPFGEILPGIFSKSVIKSKQISPTRCLFDTGSNVILAGYHTFVTWGFSEKMLRPVDNCLISGSTGTENIVLGCTTMPLFLKTDNGFMKTKPVKILITKPMYPLDFVILGGNIFTQIEFSLNFERKIPVATCKLLDQNNVIKKCNLSLLYSTKVNHGEIKENDNFCNITLKNSGFHCLEIENLSNQNITFPIVDFQHFNTCFLDDQNWPIGPSSEEVSVRIPLLNPEKLKFKSNDLNLRAVNIYHHAMPEFQENSRICNNSKIPGHFQGKFTESLDSCKVTSGGNFSGLTQSFQVAAEGESKATLVDTCQKNSLPGNSGHLSCQNFLNTFQDTEEKSLKDGKDQQIKGNLRGNNLSHNEPEATDENFLIKNPEIESSLDNTLIEQISFDTSEEIVCNNDFDKHLDKELKDRVGRTIQPFKSIFAKSKYDVGTFTGFSARISTIPNSTAVQKERRLTQHHIDGVRETMSELIKNGVFSLSEGGHDEYCANLNVVAKPSQNKCSRSKADKHIQSLPGQKVVTPTAWRMTFDLRDLNSVTTDVGRLQLPTIDEARSFARNKLVSILDISNQFWSIRLEHSSKKYTNFYYDNRIYWHERLAQGALGSPFTAQSAMIYTFSDSVLRQWKLEKNIDSTKMPYESFKDFIIFYLDDIMVASETGGNKPTFDKYELHLLCLEAVLYALEKSGWKIGLQKCRFLTQKFQFLGQTFDTTKNSTGLDETRIKAILEWRSPRSIPEVQSRLASLSYFSPQIPALRLIGLPLIQLVKKGKFKWTLHEEQAFNNLKFLIALQIRNFIHNPDFRIVITADASLVSIATCIFQLNPETGMLELLDTQSRLLNQAERTYSACQRENIAFFYALARAETVIRNSRSDNMILSDSSGIQYLQRTKNYNSRSYEQMLYLSSLPNLEVFYVTGRSLLLADLLTRQYQDVFLDNKNTLSEIQSHFVPPISGIENMAKLSNEQLVDFIMSSPEPELIDVYPKRQLYHQNLHETHVTKWNININNETQLICALKSAFNSPDALNLPIFLDIMKSQKNLSKSAKEYIVRNHNLQKLRKKIESLDLNPDIFEELLEKYRNPSLNPPSRPDADSNVNVKTNISKNENMAHPTINEQEICCRKCQELQKIIYLPSKLSKFCKNNEIFSAFLKSASELVSHVKDTELTRLLLNKQSTNCNNAIQKYDILIMRRILTLLDENCYTFQGENDNKRDITIIPFSVDQTNFDFQFSEGKLKINLKKPMTLSPLEIKRIYPKLLMFYKGNFEIIDQSDLLFLPANEHSFPYLDFQCGNIFNSLDSQMNFKIGDTILTIKFDKNDVIFVNVDPNILEYKLDRSNLENHLVSQSNLTKIVGKILDQANYCQEKEMTNMEKEEQISFLSHMAQIDKSQFYNKKKDRYICHFTSHKRILNQILLGNQLAKSQGIFSQEMMKAAQLEDFEEIILRLKDSPPNTVFDNFVLKSGILYKSKMLLGKPHLRLCLPKNLSREIVFRLHNLQNFHFSKEKMIKLFTLNFYSKNLVQIISSVSTNCLICSLFKNAYKQNISGEKREFSQMQPGQNLAVDIAYMPPSNRGCKFLLILVDLLTNYVIGYPLKKLDSDATAEKLSVYLSHFPCPSTILADGDFAFSGRFQQLAKDFGIQVRTPAPRRSQINGAVEVTIKNFKNICTKLTATGGRENWDKFIPMCCQLLNVRAPYNYQIPKASLFLGPLFYNKFFLLFSDQSNLDELIKVQLNACNKISNERKKRLLTLSQKVGNVKHNIKEGQICTDDMSIDDQNTKGGSRALLPNTRNIYKILALQDNGVSVKLRDLTNGKEYIRSLQHIRPLNLQDIPLLNLNERLMFQDFPSARINTLNIGSAVTMANDGQVENGPSAATANDGHMTDANEEQDSCKKTRSGKIFLTHKNCTSDKIVDKINKAAKKSILKKSSKIYPAQVYLDNMDPEAFLAVQRALTLKKYLYQTLSTLENQIIVGKLGSSIKKYNLPNKSKVRTEQKVKFQGIEKERKIINSCMIENHIFLSTYVQQDLSKSEFGLLINKMYP